MFVLVFNSYLEDSYHRINATAIHSLDSFVLTIQSKAAEHSFSVHCHLKSRSTSSLFSLSLSLFHCLHKGSSQSKGFEDPVNTTGSHSYHTHPFQPNNRRQKKATIYLFLSSARSHLRMIFR